MQVQISLAISAVLLFSNITNAEFGSEKEAVEAAKKGVEPGYIKPLMEALSLELQEIAHTKGIRLPNEKLAWFITMGSIISLSDYVAQKAAIEALPNVGTIFEKAALTGGNRLGGSR